MQEQYGIGAFRSRQQVMRFDSALRRAGVKTRIVSTPRDVSIGCGLSVQFDLKDSEKVAQVYRQSRPGNLIGFYRVEKENRASPRVSPL